MGLGAVVQKQCLLHRSLPMAHASALWDHAESHAEGRASGTARLAAEMTFGRVERVRADEWHAAEATPGVGGTWPLRTATGNRTATRLAHTSSVPIMSYYVRYPDPHEDHRMTEDTFL